jgi:hypothetical protein
MLSSIRKFCEFWLAFCDRWVTKWVYLDYEAALGSTLFANEV